MNSTKIITFIVLMAMVVSCGEKKIEKKLANEKTDKNVANGYEEDVTFLKKYIEIIELTDASGNVRVALSPGLQGRVMTSSATRDGGYSHGWLNKELFTSREPQEHIHVYGGEERFWLGPEGGQFSIFFKKGSEFMLDNWYTPKLIDTEAFEVTLKTDTSVVFTKTKSIVNYSGFQFDLGIRREVALLSKNEIKEDLGISTMEGIDAVAYRSINTLTNVGTADWRKESGLLSIWMLGMFPPSPNTVVIIPFLVGDEELLGPIVNDAYFGKVPKDRMVVKDSTVFFKGDGLYRSKIGLSPKRAKDIIGAYNADSNILTVVMYSKPKDVVDYVNSMWEIQEKPFSGDVVNSYNDGSPEPGEKPLGPFYELETSSPALALKAGELGVHVQQTFHLEGNEKTMDVILKELFGCNRKTLKASFNKQN